MENMDTLKSGFCSIIGRPNVGKSTLMNNIIGQKIAITSNKPQTTRNKIQTVYTDEEVGQIVFADTPGITKAKNKLGEYMVGAANQAMKDTDVILYLVEADTFIGPADEGIIASLKRESAPVILVINKIDSISKDKLPEVIMAFKDKLDYAEVVPVCARSGENVDTLIEQIFKYLPYGPFYFDADTVTDQPMKQIAAEIIREKALHALDKEVPHGIAVVIDLMKERPGKNFMYDIEATIICERESHKRIIIGKGGEMLKKIGTNARYEIEKMTEAKVNLKLWVKVKENWRESDYLVKNFGYDKKDYQ